MTDTTCKGRTVTFQTVLAKCDTIFQTHIILWQLAEVKRREYIEARQVEMLEKYPLVGQ
jgi:hypothetical protein